MSPETFSRLLCILPQLAYKVKLLYLAVLFNLRCFSIASDIIDTADKAIKVIVLVIVEGYVIARFANAILDLINDSPDKSILTVGLYATAIIGIPILAFRFLK